jgi:Amt family ammonium transporter
MEALPAMAFIELGENIVAVNSLACHFAGTCRSVRTQDLFLGDYPPLGDERRQRFECLLLPRGGRPTMVSGAVQPFAAAGELARLVLVMEPAADPLTVRREADGGGHAHFLQDLFDSLPDPTLIMQGERIVQANREFVRMFGYSQEECLGANIYELIIPDGRGHEREMLMHTVACEGRASMETVRRTRSGEELDVFITVARVRLGTDAIGHSVTYRDIRCQKQTQARLEHSALHDPLTGLANRALFLDRLTLTLARLERRPDRNFAVVFLDVDRFKQVNDTRGHAAGDTLLLAVTGRLRACLRPQDTIARFGGDEFALLLDDVGSIDDIAGVAERIQAEIQKPVEVEGGEAFVSASMGIALSSAGYSSADELMRDADHAMYCAKANGKARHEFFAADAPAMIDSGA